MKRIFLLLAAVAAFASCVKENDLVPDQPETQADNIVTLKATSSDTKAVLDGADVLWYGEEAIRVVLTEANTPFHTHYVDFTANVPEKSKNVDFTGEIGSEVSSKNLKETGFAVYPLASIPAVWDGYIYHTLSEEQNGTDVEHLSSALVKTSEIKDGNATASFNNYLTLLKITVPEGVNEVSLTASYGIVGTAKLYEPDAEGKLSVCSYSSNKTVTLSTGSELDPGTVYSVSVFPGTAETLTLSMTGDDSNDVYESTLHNVVLKPGTYRTIDLTKIFAMDVEADSEVPVSFTGGTFEVNVVAVDDKTYNVAIEDGNSWIQYVQTKAFNGKTIEFNVDSNTSTSSREADITITWDGGSRNFTVVQEGKPELSFVYVDGDPNKELIQWEETFDIFGEETLNNKITASPYIGVFTIEINEENPEKGRYIVKNIFKNSQFTSGITHMNRGGEYYANYNDGKLTILKSNANISSYVFENDVVLTYDSSLKKFTSGAIELGFTPGGPNNQNYKFIGNYEAVPYVAPDPGAGGEGDPSLNAFTGTWSETYVNKPYSWSPETIYEGEFTVSVVDGKLYFENMFIYKMSSTVYTANYYGTLSGDGKTITLEDAGSGHGYFGPLAYAGGPIVLAVEGNTLTVASAYNGQVVNYVATKQ